MLPALLPTSSQRVSLPALRSDSVLLFTGDSTTSADRDLAKPADLGRGYAFLLAATLQEQFAAPTLRAVNRGVPGETIRQLEARFARDLDEVNPSLVTIMIGVNDVCRSFEGKAHSGPAEFAACYRRLAAAVSERRPADARIILMEPFLLAIEPSLVPWRRALDGIIAALRDFAAADGLPLIPLDTIFASALKRAPATFWLWDGIHPTPAGCALIARAWLEQVRNAPVLNHAPQTANA